MSLIVLEIPDESLLALEVDPEEAAATLRMAAAVKFYELRRLSSGAAAQLAGIPRVEFLLQLADYGADAFQLTKVDLEREMRLGDKGA